MSGRPHDVDLGPMTLPLDVIGSAISPATTAARPDDALRLRSLLQTEPATLNEASDLVLTGMGDGCIDDGDSAEGIGAMEDGAGVLVTSADDARLRGLALEISAALRNGAAPPISAPAVRVSIRPSLLRETEIGVTESNGCIEFSLSVGQSADRDWLEGQLYQVAATLGARLSYRFRLVLLDPASELLVAVQSWPPELQA